MPRRLEGPWAFQSYRWLLGAHGGDAPVTTSNRNSAVVNFLVCEGDFLQPVPNEECVELCFHPPVHQYGVVRRGTLTFSSDLSARKVLKAVRGVYRTFKQRNVTSEIRETPRCKLIPIFGQFQTPPHPAVMCSCSLENYAGL